MKKILACFFLLLLPGIKMFSQVTEDDNRIYTPIVLCLQDIQDKSNKDIYNYIFSQLKNNKAVDSLQNEVDDHTGSLYPIFINDIPFESLFPLTNNDIVKDSTIIMLISDSLGMDKAFDEYQRLANMATNFGRTKTYTNIDGRKEVIIIPPVYGRVITIRIDSQSTITITVESPQLSSDFISMYNYIDKHQFDNSQDTKDEIIKYNNYFKERVTGDLQESGED